MYVFVCVRRWHCFGDDDVPWGHWPASLLLRSCQRVVACALLSARCRVHSACHDHLSPSACVDQCTGNGNRTDVSETAA